MTDTTDSLDPFADPIAPEPATVPVLQLLTASRLYCFRSCERKHFFRYIMGYAPIVDAEPLAFGTLIHKGLETWWTWWKVTHANEQPEYECAAEAMWDSLPAEDSIDPFLRAKLVAMLAGYDAAWTTFARDEVSEVLSVEVEFRAPLRNPENARGVSRTWQLAGKCDAILRLRDGRIAVLEHKTSSEDCSPGSTYRRRLVMNGQVSQYYDGADSLGYPVDLVLYDILVKPALRPLKASENLKRKKDGTPYANQREFDETPQDYLDRVALDMETCASEYFHHVEVPRFTGEREAYRFDVWQRARMMADCERLGRHPRNDDSCFSHGKTPCEYWDVCTDQASIEDPTRYRRLTNVHPELSSPR